MHANGGESEQSERDCEPSAVSGLTGGKVAFPQIMKDVCNHCRFLCSDYNGMIPLLAFDPRGRLSQRGWLGSSLCLLACADRSGL